MNTSFFAPRLMLVAAGLLLAGLFSISANAQKDLSIAEVQGDKAKSPYESQQVRVRGIVTAAKRDGIYIESPDDKTDNNPATSEGV